MGVRSIFSRFAHTAALPFAADEGGAAGGVDGAPAPQPASTASAPAASSAEHDGRRSMGGPSGRARFRQCVRIRAGRDSVVIYLSAAAPGAKGEPGALRCRHADCTPALGGRERPSGPRGQPGLHPAAGAHPPLPAAGRRARRRRRLPGRARRADARRERAAQPRHVRHDLGRAAGPAADGRVARQEHDRQGRVPATADLENRCVKMLAELWNAPDPDTAIGCSTIGSSEACMLGGLALKRRWRTPAARPGSRPTGPTS